MSLQNEFEIIMQTFLENVVKDESTKLGCWLWTGDKIGNGYGIFYYNGMSCLAHRMMWIIIHGIEGLDRKHLHHKCRVKLCVNTEHLVPLTPQEHMRRHGLERGDIEIIKRTGNGTSFIGREMRPIRHNKNWGTTKSNWRKELRRG